MEHNQPMAYELRPSKFINGDLNSDGDYKVYDGYTDGTEDCDGYMNPYFTRDQAMLVMAGWKANGKEFDARYDVDRDVFVFMTPDFDEDDPMEYYGVWRMINNEARLVFGLGHDNGDIAWLWTEVADPE